MQVSDDLNKIIREKVSSCVGNFDFLFITETEAEKEKSAAPTAAAGPVPSNAGQKLSEG